MAIGYNAKLDKAIITKNYDCYHNSEISDSIRHYISKKLNTIDNLKPDNISKSEVTIQQSDSPPMNSPWPMYCHDIRHSGQSSNSTADNLGLEKWRFDTIEGCVGCPVVDEDGTIYIGAGDFFAINPDGTQKWKYDIPGIINTAAAIDEDGIIYVGSIWGSPNYLYAFNPDGRLKWRYEASSIHASPVIDSSGIIYFCDSENWRIKALYPNGTLKWSYKTNHVIYSSPSIGFDGTIYFGSDDNYLYALYPDNGTLKWKYKTGDWVGRGPCVADDGTIYFGSWNGYLYAVYPNGTLKWKKSINFGTTPVIGQDGTIYGGTFKLYAINPNNGSTKWSFNPDEDATIRGGNPCISSDGTIFFGTHIGETDGGELIAVYPDGTERWRIMLATAWIWSAPAIGEDGTIYVGSYNDKDPSGSKGYLHAIGELDPNAPSAPEIKGPKKIKPDIEYKYKFKSTSPVSKYLYYWIEWGDNRGTGWIGGYPSGEEIVISHYWRMEKTYTIRARAKDTNNLWGPWSYYEIESPRNRVTYNSLFLHFFNQYPFLDNPLNH